MKKESTVGVKGRKPARNATTLQTSDPTKNRTARKTPRRTEKKEGKNEGVPAPGEGEVFIGLVGAVGTDLRRVSGVLQGQLEAVGWKPVEIDLIERIHTIEKWKDLPESPREVRIKQHMEAGTEFRKLTKRNDALAVYGILEIREEHRGGGAPPGAANRPKNRTAYILRSLKNEAEVKTLREIYGPSFFLISAFSDRETRINNLARDIASSHHVQMKSQHRAKAEELNAIDEYEEGEPFGQRIREAFPLADVFVDARDEQKLERELKRFIRILFGDLFQTPTPDEHAMFHAHAAALRSADLARQVGSVIATPDGDIIAVGTNEVPKGGGGLYWSTDVPDNRNFRLGKDTSDVWRRNILGEILEKLAEEKWLAKNVPNSRDARVKAAANFLKTAQVMRLNEFGRTVHAEMAAIIDAARRGISTKDQLLFCTTFPCHECARHIVAAGLKEVYFIEPYPKSYAKELHLDAIHLDGKPPEGQYVIFKTFVGISPRRYFELFQLGERKRKEDGRVIEWNASKANFRFGTLPALYVERELDEIRDLDKRMKAAGLAVI